MKTVKIFLLLSILTASIYAQTPFVLSGVKSYYPVVEINTDKIDTKYKQIILDMMVGENAIRLDTKEEIFVVSYMSNRIFIPEDVEDDLLSNAEELLEMFAAQYNEDNL